MREATLISLNIGRNGLLHRDKPGGHGRRMADCAAEWRYSNGAGIGVSRAPSLYS